MLILGDFRHPYRLNKGAKCGLSALIILIMTALRFDVGFDYFNYYDIIWSEGGDSYYDEPLSAIIMNLGHDTRYPPISFAVFSILTYGIIIYVFYKYTDNFSLSLLIYLFLFFLESMGVIRQSLAEALMLLAYPFLIKRKIWKFLAVCVVASLAHRSALICIIFYPLYNWINLKSAFIIVCCLFGGIQLVIQLFVGAGVFGSAIGHIAMGDEYSGGGLLMYINPIMSITTYIICRLKHLKVDYNIFSILLIGAALPLLIGPHYGMRVARYFNIYLCFLIPQMLSYFSAKLRMAVCSVGVCYFMIYISVGWNKSRPTIAPYQTIFEIENVAHPKFRLP